MAGTSRVLTIPPGGARKNLRKIASGNLPLPRSNFFEAINLDYPGLEKVKAAFNKSDLPTARKELLEHFKTRTKPTYYSNWRKKDEIVKLINEKFPKYFQKLIVEADSVMTHIFTFEGDKRDVGKNVNWMQDSPGGNKSWAQIISRFCFAAPLLSAYWATGNEKYSREYIYLVKDWIKDNPRPLLTVGRRSWSRELAATPLKGWTSLNTGIRTKAWVDAYSHLFASPSWQPETNTLFLRSLLEQAEYLFEVQLHRGNATGGNWQAFECSGLLSVAVMFPEFKKSKIWRDKVYDILNLKLQKEVYDDGGHWELNTGYQGCVMRALFGSILLAKRNGIELPPGYLKRYEKMFDYLAATSMPDSTWPRRGDGPISPGGGRGFLMRGALLFGRGDFKFLGSKPSAKELMLFGHDVFKKYQTIKVRKPSFTSIALPNSQHVIMRTGWDKDGLYLMLNCAPWGGCHSHPDHLNIDVYGYGQLLITDSGMPCYDWKLGGGFCKKTKGHNVIIIDGEEQPIKVEPNPITETFITTSNFDFAQGLLENYVGAKQQRSIIFIKPDYWIMVDRLDEMEPTENQETHSVKQLFHFAPTLLTLDENAKTVHSSYSHGNILLAPPGADKIELVEQQGWVAFSRIQ